MEATSGNKCTMVLNSVLEQVKRDTVCLTHTSIFILIILLVMIKFRSAKIQYYNNNMLMSLTNVPKLVFSN